MSIWSIFNGENIAAATFKPSANGFVFKAPPGSRLFGLAPHYEVSEAQKAAITAAYKRYWFATMLAIIPLVAAIIGLQVAVPKIEVYVIPVAALAGGLVGLSVLAAYIPALRRILKDAKPTDERIRWREQQASVIANTSAPSFAFFAALSIVMAALSLMAVFAPTIPFFQRITGITLFGFGAVYFVTMLILKLRRSRA